MSITDLLAESRSVVQAQKVLGSRQWSGLHRLTGTNYLLSRPGSGPRRLIIQDVLHWYDAVDGRLRDGYDLFCLLSGLQPEAESTVLEFLALAGAPLPKPENVGTAWTGRTTALPADAGVSKQLGEKNVGTRDRAGTFKRTLENQNKWSANSAKKKTAPDLLQLIASDRPIAQHDLFRHARANGINEKYARRFLHELIASKSVSVCKIPRQKTKSALGYCRTVS